MKSFFLIVILILLVVENSLSQKVLTSSHIDRLPWVSGQLPSQDGNFTYVISTGDGTDLEKAKEDAYNSFLQDLGNQTGKWIENKSVIEMRNENSMESDGIALKGGTSFTSTYVISSEKFYASFRKISEYYECVYDDFSKKYLVWQLYAYTTSGLVKINIPKYNTSYGIPPIWRSAVLPGWGQFYKKKTGRGIALLASEALLISTTFYCEAIRSDNLRKSNETLNIAIVKEYRSRADTWEQRRNIAIGGAIAVYAFNLLDAALGKGQLKYACIPGNLDLLAYKEGNMNQFGLKFTF